MPQFFIIAGPNGAGKSTYGHMHIPQELEVFNGDLVFAELVLKYPHIEPERLVGGVTSALEKAIDSAFQNGNDFAFESNFSNDMAIDITRRFKAANYQTALIYFGLNNFHDSLNRVILRTQIGGHDLPNENIRFNLEEGIKRVNAHFGDFDHIRFVDTGKPFTARVIAFFNRIYGKYQLIDADIDWFNRDFKSEFEKHIQSSLSQ